MVVRMDKSTAPDACLKEGAWNPILSKHPEG